MSPVENGLARPQRKRSVAYIARALLAISMMSIGLMGAGAFIVSYHFLHQQTQRHLHTLLALTATEIAAPLQFRDAATATEVLRSVPHEEGIVLARVEDENGAVLAEIDDRGNSLSLRFARWLGVDRTTQDIIVDGRRLGSVTLEGGSEPLLQVLVGLFVWCLLGMLVIALTSLILARRHTQRITRPLFDLHDVIKSLLEHRDFNQRASPSELAEVEELRLEFNSLLDEIATRDTLLQQSNAALTRIAYVDTLTGLPNRATFEQSLLNISARPASPPERVGLLYLDIDGFKQVNDALGHALGDQLLAEIGARLRASQASQALAARVGGDEFVSLVSPLHSVDTIAQLVADLQESLDRPFVTNEYVIHPRVSIGFAVYPDTVATIDRLVDSADRSMYDAKGLRHRQGQTTRWEAHYPRDSPVGSKENR